MKRTRHRRKGGPIRPALVGAIVLLGVLLWLLASWWMTSRTREPGYELLERTGTYEVRHYPEVTVAQIVIFGPFEDSVRQGMVALNAYRSGRNLQPLERILASKDETGKSEVIPLSAPFIIQQEGGNIIISLVLPDSVTPETAPRPMDPRVRIITMERQRVAVREMPSSVEEGLYIREYSALMTDLEHSQLLILSEPRAAYYGPSWVFWLLRRAEVHVRVR